MSTHYIEQVRANYGKFSPHFSGPSIWNNLDEETKSLSRRLLQQSLTTLNAGLVFFFL